MLLQRHRCRGMCRSPCIRETYGGNVASTRSGEVRDYGFADRAVALRERAGLTQPELAGQLGFSTRAIQTWESGESYPGAERLRQLIVFYLARGVLTAGREEE